MAKIEPDKPHGFHNIGMSYTLQGDIDKAKFYYEMALNVDSNFPESNHNLSFIHLRNGNFKEGWEKYEYRLICNTNLKNQLPIFQNGILIIIIVIYLYGLSKVLVTTYSFQACLKNY